MTIAEERRQKAALDLAEAVTDGKLALAQVVEYREAREQVKLENEAQAREAQP